LDDAPVLASLLPGFREVRAPLVAGLAWLTVAWLWIDLPSRASAKARGGVKQDLLELGDAAGRPGLVAAALLGAYLIGSLAEAGRRWLIGRRWLRMWLDDRRPDRFVHRGVLTDRGAGSLTQHLDEALRDIASSAHQKGYEDVREALGRRSDDPVADHLHVADWETLIPDLSEEVVRDLPLVRTRLVSDHPEHAAEYDRLQAEGTLRVALAAPLVLFLVTVAVRDSLFWLLGLLAVLALAREGLTRTEEAGDVIVDALLAGIITAPAVDRVRTRVENAPDETRRDRATFA
jgi:hypothetical protein